MVTFTKRAKKKITKKVSKKAKGKKSTKTLETPVIKASVQKKYQGQLYQESTKDNTLQSEYVVEDMATVGVVIGATTNLENYESVKISVSLHMRCPDSKIDEKIKFISKKVGKYLNQVGKEQGL